MLAFITFRESPYRDVFLHGGTVKYLLDNDALSKGTLESSWPLSYYLHALFIIVSNFDIIVSNGVLFMVISIFFVIVVILLMKFLLASANIYEFKMLLFSSMLIYYTQFYHYYSFVHYCRALLGTFLLMAIYYFLIKIIQDKKYSYSNIILLFFLLSSLFYTHPFYSVIYLGSILFTVIDSYILEALPIVIRSKSTSSSQRAITGISILSVILFLIVNLLQTDFSINAVYAHIVKGTTGSILEFSSGIIQIKEKIPLEGVIIRNIWKAMLIILLLQSILYFYISFVLFKQIPRMIDRLFLGHTISSIILFVIFLIIPGFTGRIIAFLAVPLSYFSVQSLVLIAKKWKKCATILSTYLYILSLISFVASNILVFFDPPISGSFVMNDVIKPFYQIVHLSADLRLVFLQNSPLYILSKYFPPYKDRIIALETLKSIHSSLFLCIPSIDIIACQTSFPYNSSLVFNSDAVYSIYLP
jgi:hypothetical protein